MTPYPAVLALAGAFLAAPSARAATAEPSLMKALRVTAPERIGLSSCRKSPQKTWTLVRIAFENIFQSHLTEIEAAEPGRFFPGTLASAEKVMDREGHFTRVVCRGGRPCPELRSDLEIRTLEVTLLRSLPVENPTADLYDPKTWQVSALGRSALQEAERCWPDVKSRVAALAAKALRPPR